MDKPQPFPPVGPGCVESVLVVNRYERTTGHIGQASSQPGHLLQLATSGRSYEIHAGSLIWYHENEWVRTRVLQGPWIFYSVNFIAPTLTPPPFEQRVRQVGAATRRAVLHLYDVWRDLGTPPQTRQLRVQAGIFNLLASLPEASGQSYTMNEAARLWWSVEAEVRADLSRPFDLARLSSLCGKSPATLARSCRAAVGLPPLKRIKQVRMSLARGLVQRSGLRIGEIAQRIGYDRVHEFSRDYRKAFGQSPRADRG